MKLLNSDKLRAKLSKNVRKMNLLTEQNDEIVELLSSRGLKPTSDADCLMLTADSFKVIRSDGSVILQWPPKPEPLTADELKAGGWWMASSTKTDADAFMQNGLDVFESAYWSDELWPICRLGIYGKATQAKNMLKSEKQIHRIGNNFYWGAPSDQAN